jgi:membrane-associated phospholipid phosphatase
MEPWGERLKTYGLWGAASGLAFVCVYPTCNWLTSVRSHHYHVYLQGELDIPFRPEWIWVYLSMYLLFAAPPFYLDCGRMRRLGLQLVLTTLAAGVSFLMLPTTLGFPRTPPPGGPLHNLYAILFTIDKPHNLIPSLHVIWSTSIALAVADCAPRPQRLLVLSWAVLIALSTLLVHQHHLIDLGAAYLFVFLARKYTGVRKP